jgi:hypothetical protein
MKVYVDDDTTIKKSGKSTKYDIDDISDDDYLKVTYYETGSKIVATYIIIY